MTCISCVALPARVSYFGPCKQEIRQRTACACRQPGAASASAHPQPPPQLPPPPSPPPLQARIAELVSKLDRTQQTRQGLESAQAEYAQSAKKVKTAQSKLQDQVGGPGGQVESPPELASQQCNLLQATLLYRPFSAIRALHEKPVASGCCGHHSRQASCAAV